MLENHGQEDLRLFFKDEFLEAASEVKNHRLLLLWASAIAG